MHVQFTPDNYDIWLQYYAGQAAQTGYGLEGFKGIPYQRGVGLGSFFRSLFRMAIPVLQSIGRNVGKHALVAGANIASDVAQGRPLFKSAKEHSKRETAQLLDEASKAIQGGEGLGSRPKSINTRSNDIFSNTRKNVSHRHKVYPKH